MNLDIDKSFLFWVCRSKNAPVKLWQIGCIPFASLILWGILLTNASAQSGLIVTNSLVQASHDTIPRFCNVSIAGSPIISNLSSGDWSNPAIWPDNTVPTTDARVQIKANTQVVYDALSSTPLSCIEVRDQAVMQFKSTVRTRLVIDELMVMPGGTLTIGTELSPVSSTAVAEVVIRGDTDLKTGSLASPGLDPAQYGKGLIVFGKIQIHGRKVDTPFVRFSQEASASNQLLHLKRPPIGWLPGDLLIIPDTRQISFTANKTFVSQAEEVLLESVSSIDVSITTPLVYNHHGPRDISGNVGSLERQMLPHVGNLSRNVIIRSGSPVPNQRRGHAIFLHRSEVDIRYALFKDFGRTTIANLDNTVFDGIGQLQSIGSNQVGRYSIHLHHLWGPENPSNSGYQYKIIGNVMHGMNKWGLTVHDTHFGLIKDNIAYAGVGSAIATEDGNESYNVFEGNFVVHTEAGSSQPILSTNVGRGGVLNSRALFGTTRDAFWFSGPYNYVRDNVAANTPDFAFNYNGYYIKDTMRVPRFRGADMHHSDQYEGWNYHGSGSQFVEGRDRREGLPALESARNEAYGATGQGL